MSKREGIPAPRGPAPIRPWAAAHAEYYKRLDDAKLDALNNAYYKELRSGKTQWEAPGPNNLVNNEWKHDAINNSATPWLNVRTGLRAAQIPI